MIKKSKSMRRLPMVTTSGNCLLFNRAALDTLFPARKPQQHVAVIVTRQKSGKFVLTPLELPDADNDDITYMQISKMHVRYKGDGQNRIPGARIVRELGNSKKYWLKWDDAEEQATIEEIPAKKEKNGNSTAKAAMSPPEHDMASTS